MKTQIQSVVVSALLAIPCAMGLAQAQTITFDDLSSTRSGNNWSLIPSGYAGLQWNNFGVINGAVRPDREGYHNGMVSPTNVAFNIYGDPASLSSATPLNVDSLYLAEQAENNMTIRIQGWAGATLAYNNTYSLSTTGALFIQLNYVGVDRLLFLPPANNWLVLDNLTVAANSNAPACTFTISPASNTHGSGVETGIVTVTTQTGCPWAVHNENTWVTILSSINNSNSGTVTYRVGANARAIARSGELNIAGQSFPISQAAGTVPTNFTPVNLGTIELTSIGHGFFSQPFLPPGQPTSVSVADYLIDQSGRWGGGGLLPTVAANWDTNIQFVLKVAAPAGHKIVIRPPSGHPVRFAGFLWWKVPARGGSSPVGPVAVSFDDLEGTAPDFAGSDAVLSSSHGFFAFSEVISTTFSDELAFTAMTLTGTVTPQYSGYEVQTFFPHLESDLKLVYPGGTTNDPAFVSIEAVDPPPGLGVQSVSSNSVALNVRGRAGRTYIVECSEDLVRWRRIATNTAGSTVRDVLPRANRRFYRTFEGP